MKFSVKTLMVFIGAALAACGSDDENENSNNNNNNNTPSLQQQAFDDGQIGLADAAGIAIDSSTLAVTGIVPAAPATALPTGFAAANYYGAVDPAASTPYWQGWTAIDSDFQGGLPGADFHPLEAEIGTTITGAATNGCTGLNADFTDGGEVTIFGEVFPVCVIDSDIEADTDLVNSHVFVLANTINVGTGDAQLSGAAPSTNVTLDIEEGTQIYARVGTGSGDITAVGASLVATRGSKIEAVGTRDEPIIMASVAVDLMAADVITGDPTDLTARGAWGGMVLSGFGITNRGDSNGEATTEAAPADADRYFGGNDNTDDSGTVRYVIIAESGFAFRTDEEVQGLTIEGAGSGTEIDYLQIIGSNDDCIEWFGGAANASHIICNGVRDDGLDIDTGYVGRIQFAIVRLGTTEGARGIESDSGSSSNFDLLPRSAPQIANVTILGNAGDSQGDANIGALHREGIAPKVYRSVYTDDVPAGGTFEAGCLDIDNQLEADLAYVDAVFNCTGGTTDGLVEDTE